MLKLLLLVVILILLYFLIKPNNKIKYLSGDKFNLNNLWFNNKCNIICSRCNNINCSDINCINGNTTNYNSTNHNSTNNINNIDSIDSIDSINNNDNNTTCCDYNDSQCLLSTTNSFNIDYNTNNLSIDTYNSDNNYTDTSIKFNYELDNKNNTILNNMKTWYPNTWIQNISNNEYIYNNSNNDIYSSALIKDNPKLCTINNDNTLSSIYDSIVDMND